MLVAALISVGLSLGTKHRELNFGKRFPFYSHFSSTDFVVSTRVDRAGHVPGYNVEKERETGGLLFEMRRQGRLEYTQCPHTHNAPIHTRQAPRNNMDEMRGQLRVQGQVEPQL